MRCVNQDDDSNITRLQTLLDGLPAPLEPLDPSAIDGYLCGVLLQPRRIADGDWLPGATDIEGRPAPPGPALDELHDLLRQRHAFIDSAIERRDWFDPWVFLLDEDEDETPPAESMLPWVAGFAAAMDRFPALMNSDDPELIEPLALLYLHFDPADLEDADALLAVIETLEPPADLGEAVQDLVRALMLMAAMGSGPYFQRGQEERELLVGYVLNVDLGRKPLGVFDDD